MAPIVDCHAHTDFSDGESTLEETVRFAAQLDCRALVVADHLALPASMDPHLEVQVPLDRLPEHRAAFEAARQLASELSPRLELVYGFECDWYPGCEENVARWSEGASVRLGSVHWLGDPGDTRFAAGTVQGADVAPAGLPGTASGWIDDPNDLHIWEELGADEVWRRYADAWCRACESPLDFDVMAHPDLAARFRYDGYAPSIDLEPLWERMAECARDTGRRVEVSTAGMRKSVRDYHPTQGLLERFARAEVPITFGSDAHRAWDVCWEAPQAQRYAFSCGYFEFDMPRANSGWTTCSII